jgi:hypothetical protein
MVVYNCLRCGYSSNYKNNMKTHVFRKKLCLNNFQNLSSDELKEKFLSDSSSFIHNPIFNKKPLNDTGQYNLSDKKDNYVQCEFCQGTFSTASNLKKHTKLCKDKPNDRTNDDLMDFIMKQSEKYENQIKIMEIRELEREKKWEERELILRKEIEQLLEKVGTNITNIQNQNNIFINNHGSENLDYIESSTLGYLINIPFGALPKLLKIIHFNPNHPENHNIKITNKKLPYASIYKDSKWILTDKKEVIDNILDKGFNLLEDHYEHNNTHNNKYEKFKIQYEEGDKKLKKQLDKDMEITIINECKEK